MRYYNIWFGNLGGTPEDIMRCIEPVSELLKPFYYRQCARPRGHGLEGLYCKQHAKFHPKVVS